MRTRRIGPLEVSEVGIGCNTFGRYTDAEQTAAIVNHALDSGVNFFDTADVYGDRNGLSETLLGRALAGRRGEAVIATKFGMEMAGDPQRRGASARWVRQACEDSLRRLGVDHIDLYQLHQPDPATPVAETVGALEELVEQGKVRQIGHSNLSGSEIDEAAGAGTFVSAQFNFSLLMRDAERDGVLDAVRRNELAVLPYYPLAAGLLTGKYRKDGATRGQERLRQNPVAGGRDMFDDALLAHVERLADFVQAQGRTLLELAFGWLLSHDEVASVIAGVTRPQQIEANIASSSWRLTDDERAEIDRIEHAATS